jgi:hypothetical protein
MDTVTLLPVVHRDSGAKGEFFGYGKQRDFALSVWRKRLEDEFLIEASDQFRAKEFVELGNHSPLERGEWEPGGTKKLLRADVAGANDVKARKIIRTMIAERDSGGIEHLQEQILYQAMGLFDFVDKQNPLLVLREDLSESPGFAGFIPMNSFALSRCRNPDISKRKRESRRKGNAKTPAPTPSSLARSDRETGANQAAARRAAIRADRARAPSRRGE